jgi:hypothetical protein
MFERVTEKRGRDAIRRLVGLFKLAAVGSVLSGVLFVLVRGTARPVFAGINMAFSLLCAVGAWATANGLDDRKRWARNAGFVIASLTVLNLGIGTIFGLIELYSLWRAQSDGLFTEKADAA